DDLSGMAAITDTYSISEAVTASLSAGSDVALWLSTDQVPGVLDALEEAVADGRLPIEQVDASVTRILVAKQLSTPCVDGVWYTDPAAEIPPAEDGPATPHGEEVPAVPEADDGAAPEGEADGGAPEPEPQG